MSKSILVPLSLFIGAALAAAQPQAISKNSLDAEHSAKMAKGLEVFKSHVRQTLLQRCLRCHGGKSTEAELDLSDRDRLLRGGMTGTAVVVGDARNSLLYRLINHAKQPRMPKGGRKLSAEEIRHFADWIDLGAPYDKSLVAAGTEGPTWTEKTVPETARAFWSFQPLSRVQPPAVRDDCSIRTPIDRFIVAKQEAVHLRPNPPASRRQLIRRVYFDLIGLPPTPEEVETFARDRAVDAYEKLIDRLLASQHYGERWGRHWLDLARFGESHGFEHDYDRRSAYHYRDFVIKALNADLPYDTFVKWQLAGDEFAPDDNLALLATGFLAAGVHSTQITVREVEKHRYDEMDDMAATVGTAMLGLTIGCCRCHDHKFDPLPQADYYRFVSTFTTTVRSEIDVNFEREKYQKAKEAFDREHAPLAAALGRFEKEKLPPRKVRLEKAWQSRPDRFNWLLADSLIHRGVRWAELERWTRTSDAEWRALRQQEWDHKRRTPKPNLVKALISSEGLPALRLHTQGDDFFKQCYFLRRGDPEQKDGVAKQGFLQVLMTATDGEKRWQLAPPNGSRTSYRRRALAEWITDVDYGAGNLLARVIVNRLWQHHMGRGIVATPSEFGVRGERPTHPELLDWLATELIRNGWRLKPIHKLIMTSAAYTQSSAIDERKQQVDRENRLFWRRPRMRLEAETIRDALLAVSGTLDPGMFGPGTLDENSPRRSIYFTVKRSYIIPMLQVFDVPDALQGIGERPTTTIAPQALLLMNNPNVRGYARQLATRAAPDAKTKIEDAVIRSYLITLSRHPTADELADSIAFLCVQAESYRGMSKANEIGLALTDFCQTLLCLNEFVYVD
jgi:cytochrome c553